VLAPDTYAGIVIGAWAGNYAIGISYREWTRPLSVARLSLAAIACPDRLQHQLDRAAARPVDPSPVFDWPPRSIVLELLACALEVAAGRRWLVAPDGYRVRHLARDRGPAAGRAVLQVWRAGDLVGEVADVAALAALLGPQGLEQLVEEPAEDAEMLFEPDELG
jgi:hypothetical protein